MEAGSKHIVMINMQGTSPEWYQGYISPLTPLSAMKIKVTSPLSAASDTLIAVKHERIANPDLLILHIAHENNLRVAEDMAIWATAQTIPFGYISVLSLENFEKKERLYCQQGASISKGRFFYQLPKRERALSGVSAEEFQKRIFEILKIGAPEVPPEN